jgi:putative metallohydrolase (TIGR04338 family)
MTDVQVKRVYACDHALTKTPLVLFHDIKMFVQEVQESDWYRSMWPTSQKLTVAMSMDSSMACYWPGQDTIHVPTREEGLMRKRSGDWAWNKETLLHEIAHHVGMRDALGPHGKQFAGAYLALVTNVISVERGNELEALFISNKVKYLVPKPIR